MIKHFLLILCGTGLPWISSGAAPDKPNVVIIYGDDVGYGDIGANGATRIPTPNIDRLAREGLNFTDAHCSASTCSPSRFSLLTGVQAFREGVEILPPDAPLCIPTDIMTLPRLFRLAGYTTGVIGKWHLGLGAEKGGVDWNSDVKPGPLEIGFDYSYLLPITNDRVPCVYLDGHRVVNLDVDDPLYITNTYDCPEGFSGTVYPNGLLDKASQRVYQADQQHACSVINGIGRIGYQWGGKAALWDDATMTDHFVDKTKAYIAAHKDERFFLYFSSQDIHVPRMPHPRFRGRTELGFRGDAMVQFDWATGEILKVLEEYGLTENTIVIFSSDNGPVYNDGYEDGCEVIKSTEEVDQGHDGSGIYRGGKYQIYEGGTRVPFIIRWPEHIKPGTSDAMVNQIDFAASFAALLGIELPAGAACDSRNTLAAFMGKDPKGLRFMIEESPFGQALRDEDWKYIPPQRKDWNGTVQPAELYNLQEDPGETRNVFANYPEIAARMDEELKKRIKRGRADRL